MDHCRSSRVILATSLVNEGKFAVVSSFLFSDDIFAGWAVISFMGFRLNGVKKISMPHLSELYLQNNWKSFISSFENCALLLSVPHD